MIECRSVTKRFGPVEAVHDLSFRAPKGQIVGLLGQNGAGKTTTLNMLTGYLPPTSGQVLVDGMDMMLKPRDCKRRIGYLPERPPLYDEMTVTEYLRFCCELKEVQPRSIKPHIDDMMQLCGLTDVRGRLLGQLSKGYRQRAGFAQALCGDPEVLVLDEPTVGLDPRQVVEIRDLMRTLGQTHTVLFSSHLLSEVQQLCQRVVILHHGQMIREAELDVLDCTGSVRLRATIQGSDRVLMPALKSLPCMRRVKLLSCRNGLCDVQLECAPAQPGEDDAPTQLFHLLCGLDMPIQMLMPQHDSLEDVFLRLTRDDEEVQA